MSMGMLDDHEGPWTEADWLALGETHMRIELLDGSLLVTPSASHPHQDISARLWAILEPAARAARLRTRLAVNLRLGRDRFVIPDLIVTGGPRVAIFSEAPDVVLTCEITSPGNAALDRTLKMPLYAVARIPWFLLVEPDFADYESVTLSLHRLKDGEYVEHARAKQGETLTSDVPFPIAISTEELLDF
ncbi:Uma2 family endonuclease [Actinoplanes octamycinicus]|uniref:Uma2 family endonuclease n=1 Tax=Actinoplanes octamycinicus TaxID=135948 RepID=A0A7W7GYN2_9ACTN|nr:Uma2 family endonuclease [Actinoplanes octamycinicus]MBB4740652.1 Uma2 family endonuclease [Actinoplanes octamycinicus]GIE63589.1 hypothetical protein Aoc01nite_89910 [Actinoplanes octamycinicus]